MEDVPADKLLFDTAIDYRAEHDPQKPVAFLPKGNHVQDGFFELNYKALAKAVNQTAWWLDDALGGKSTAKIGTVPTIPYIGPNDFRYCLLLLACLKTRRKLFTPLPSNTAEGHVKLLQKLNCSVVLAPSSHLQFWKEPAARIEGLRVVSVPDISYFIHDHPVEPYPSNRTTADASDDTVHISHTSGTTGDPKPVALRHGHIDEFRTLRASHGDAPDQRVAATFLLKGTYLINFTPLSWAVGLMQTLYWPLLCESVSIMAPTSLAQPVSAEHAFQVMINAPRGPRNGMFLVPSVIRELAANTKTLAALGKYDFILFAGAPLDQQTGDKVSQYTRVQSLMGATESNVYPFLLNDPRDWNIHRIAPRNGAHLQHFADDLYELCLHRKPNEHKHIFTDPDMKVAHTRDLFRAVPEREGYYSNAGRVDDFVKLSSLTKLNGTDVEQILDRNPDIKASVVAGNGRARPFVIIEPSPSLRQTTTSDTEIVDHIWPSLEEANKRLYAETRLIKELTLITSSDKPMEMTGKSTPNRRITLSMYEDKVEQMYSALELNGFNPDGTGYSF